MSLGLIFLGFIVPLFVFLKLFLEHQAQSKTLASQGLPDYQPSPLAQFTTPENYIWWLPISALCWTIAGFTSRDKRTRIVLFSIAGLSGARSAFLWIVVWYLKQIP